MDKGVGGLKNWTIFVDVICVSSPIFFRIISKWYAHFTHPLSKVIFVILKITSQNPKYVSQFLKKNVRLRQGKSLATLGIFIAKWVSNDNSNAMKLCSSDNHFITATPIVSRLLNEFFYVYSHIIATYFLKFQRTKTFQTLRQGV